MFQFPVYCVPGKHLQSSTIVVTNLKNSKTFQLSAQKALNGFPGHCSFLISMNLTTGLDILIIIIVPLTIITWFVWQDLSSWFYHLQNLNVLHKVRV